MYVPVPRAAPFGQASRFYAGIVTQGRTGAPTYAEAVADYMRATASPYRF